MTPLVGPVVLLLSLLSLFHTADCFSLPGGGECGLSGLTYGGRLHVPELVRSTNQWDRRKIFVFQKNGRDRFGMRGFGGRGRIVVTRSESCHDAQSAEFCPMEENEPVPCMDTSIPCSIDLGPPAQPPQYTDRSPLRASNVSPGGLTISRPVWNEGEDTGTGPVGFWICSILQEGGVVQNYTVGGTEHSHDINLPPGTTFSVRVALISEGGELSPFTDWQSFTIPPCEAPDEQTLRLNSTSRHKGSVKLIANWNYAPQSGRCAVVTGSIHFMQLDKDGCSREESSNLTNATFVIDVPTQREKRMKGEDPNSNFEVTVTLTTLSGQSFSFSRQYRTMMIAPFGIPVVTRQGRGKGRKSFSWTEFQCGQRNSDEDIKYEYEMEVKGDVWRNDTVVEPSVLLESIPKGMWTFRVRAVTSLGHSEWGEASN